MTDVLIVGAGPTGLTLACELARRGVAHRLVDLAPEPFAGSRAKGTQPRTPEVFDHLGIADEVAAAGLAELPYRQYAEGGHRDIPRPGLGARPDVPWPSPLIIPQWRVEQALRTRLESFGGRVEFATQLVAVAQGADGVRATLSSGGRETVVDASWLVGCDGRRSTVRHAMAVQFVGETLEDVRMLVGDLHVDGLDRDHWHMWRTPGGITAMCPLAGTDQFQLQLSIAPGQPDTPDLATMQALVDERTGGLGLRLSAPTWTSLWRANIRMVDHYRDGRLFLAGDAAHVHTPAGGQGMNTGIQDAFNLGWKLAAVVRGAEGALLDTYELERLPVARGVLGLSTKLGQAVMAGGGTIPRTEEAFQLGIQYRDSPLSRELRATPGRVRAGDRAPDAPALRDASGRTLRLFDVLRGPHATLLAFGGGWLPVLEAALAAGGDALRAVDVLDTDAPLPAPAGVLSLQDTQGHAAAAFEPGERALFAVRPDGMVGLATDRADASAVLAWLRDAGLPAGRL